MKTCEELDDAAMLLRLVAQGEKDLEEERVLPQTQALERVRSRIKVNAVGLSRPITRA